MADSIYSDVWAKTETRRKEGKKRAEANRAKLKANMHRYQLSIYLRKMIKALEIHSWQNTIDDWQRYYEAKIVLGLRRKRK